MKPKAIIMCSSEYSINYVYTAEQLKRISELTELRPGVVSDFTSGDFRDVEIIFSTWGMLRPSEEDLAARFPNLKAVFYSAGATDAFARPFFARNVKVFSAWLANAIPVAEFCVAQILLAMKGYFRNSRNVTSLQGWKNKTLGPGVYGETVALIGAGAISNKVQELLKPFKLKVIVVPSRKERRTISLEDAFSTAFVVSNHLPNREDNIHCINRTHFELMREGATFINTGRGAQINEADMIDVFKKRTDLTALLDVTCPEPPEEGSELYSMPNIHLSTHIAGSINDEVHRMSDYMVEELELYLAGKPTRYEVCEDMLLTSRN